jgi:hypothetical protein
MILVVFDALVQVIIQGDILRKWYLYVILIDDNQRLNFSRWFYDSNLQYCRRNTNHVENFVYFHFRRDCRRLCSIVRQKKIYKTSKQYLLL